MLWTLSGLCLLLGLGIVSGSSFALAIWGSEGYKGFLLAVGCVAFIVAVSLIIRWSGVAGGA